MKIVDFAPRRAPKQRRFRDLIPGAFVIAACVLAPAEIPHRSAADVMPHTYVSPIPTPNRALLPTIPESKQAGGSAVRHPAIQTAEPTAVLPSPTPAPSTEVTEIIRAVFGSEARTALAIAKAESSLDCSARSATGDSGLFQVNDVHLPKFQGHSPFDCYANALVAKQIYDRQGWSPWAVYASGKYRRFL